MRKWILSFAIMLMAISTLQAQDAEPVPQQSVWRLGLLGPNLEYEAKLSNTVTLDSEAGLTFAFGYGGNQIGTVFEYALYTSIRPRYYYNLGKRQWEGKSVHHYAGNYVSLTATAVLHEVLSSRDEPNRFILGPTWGLQRNIGDRWFFNFEIGAGLVTSEEETYLGPIIGLDIGFQL